MAGDVVMLCFAITSAVLNGLRDPQKADVQMKSAFYETIKTSDPLIIHARCFAI